MPRTRDLRPGFFKNEDLAECEPLARILFQGLWILADREGRLEDRPKKIKTEILPYDNCDIEKLLNQLVKFKFILRYEIEDKRVICIPTFVQNQRVHPKEAPSVLPEYAAVEPRQAAVLPGISDANRSFPSFPSLPTITSSPALSPKPPKGGSELFQKFYSAYPKKTTKQEALEYWLKNKLDDVAPEIFNGLDVWKMTDTWVHQGGKFMPDPIRFLRHKRWTDQPPPASNGKSPANNYCALPGNQIVPSDQRKGGKLDL